MPVDKKFAWLNDNLFRYCLNKSAQNPSRINFLQQGRRFRNWYDGESFLAPIEGIDDTKVDEQNATARRNVIGETIDETGSIFLKNNPIIIRTPYRPDQAKLSDGLDALWLWSWGQSFGKTVFRSVMEDAQITGMGSSKIFWDPRKANRYYPGQVVMKSIPGEMLFVDPDATNDHFAQDAKFIFQKVMRYPYEIVARYGDEGAAAIGWKSAIGRDKNSASIMSMLGMSNEEATQRVDGSSNWQASSGQDSSSEKIPVYEAWIFPTQMFGSELVTGENIKETFRFGVVGTIVNDKVIHVKESPCAKKKKVTSTDENGRLTSGYQFVGHGTHPFMFMTWARRADKQGNRRFYDVRSMIEWMIPLQFNVNALRRNMAIILRSLANPVIAYNEDALATPANKIVYVPGQMIKVRGQYHLDDAIKILTPAQMPPQVESMIATDIMGIKEAGGVKPGLIGLFPAPGGGTSHTAAATIGTLQESAFAPLWKYVEEVGMSLTHASRLYDGLIQQHFEVGHYLGVHKNGQDNYIQWTAEHITAQFKRTVVSGATTPLYDIEKEKRMGTILEMTISALISEDPRVMRATAIFLEDLNFPYTEQYLQLLQEELQRLEQKTQSLQEVGMGAIGEQLALPASGTGQPGEAQNAEFEDVTSLAGELGVDPEQLVMASVE